MSMEIYLEKFGGWVGLGLYFVYKEVWPLIANKLVPSQIKANENRRASAEKMIQAERAALESDRQFHRELERERLTIQAEQSKSIQHLAVTMAQTNERIVTIIANQQMILARQEATFGVVTDAIADMRAATGVKVSKEK